MQSIGVLLTDGARRPLWPPSPTRGEGKKNQDAAARLTAASASVVRLSSVFFSSCRVDQQPRSRLSCRAGWPMLQGTVEGDFVMLDGWLRQACRVERLAAWSFVHDLLAFVFEDDLDRIAGLGRARLVEQFEDSARGVPLSLGIAVCSRTRPQLVGLGGFCPIFGSARKICFRRNKGPRVSRKRSLRVVFFHGASLVRGRIVRCKQDKGCPRTIPTSPQVAMIPVFQTERRARSRCAASDRPTDS